MVSIMLHQRVLQQHSQPSYIVYCGRSHANTPKGSRQSGVREDYQGHSRSFSVLVYEFRRENNK